MIISDTVWLGDDASFHEVHLHQLACLKQFGTMNPMLCNDEEDENRFANPIQVDYIGNLAVVSINGSMVTEASKFTRYYGIVAYSDIKERFYEVKEQGQAKAILMNFNTGGGQAQGVSSTTKFIRSFNNSVLPVIGYTSTKALSAGYWLLSGTSRVVADAEANLGSIGAINIHTDMTEYFSSLGIKHTVFRSAPFKALGTPYEKLDDKARAELNKDIMIWHNRFATGISEMRGIDVNTVNRTIANGRVYQADEAVGFKMIDSILSFEETVAKLNAALEKKPNPASAVN